MVEHLIIKFPGKDKFISSETFESIHPVQNLIK